jgi:lysophospholipase
MSPPCFTLDQAEELRSLLPELVFGPDGEGVDCDYSAAKAYLACYGLDFSEQYPGLVHALGCISALDFKIAVQYWIPPGAKGTLLVVHGYYDHLGIYDKVVAFGLAQGLAVLGFDLPGHGLSSGERAAIDSFDQYGDVLETVLQRAKNTLPSPWYAIGQSTGGAVLLNHLWRYEAECEQPVLSRTVICSPLVLPRGWGGGRVAYALLHRFIKTLPRGRSYSSHDAEFIRFIDEEDCLQSRRLSVRWVGAMKRWDLDFGLYPCLQQRILIIQGTEDLTVAWRYNLKQIQAKLPQAQIEMVKGAGHQLVNERSDLRNQVFAQISRFFFNI